MDSDEFQINLSYVTGIIYVLCFGWQCSIPRYILNCSERLLESMVFVILCSNQIIQLVAQNSPGSSGLTDNDNSRKLFNECTAPLCYLDNVASCFQTWFIIWIWIPRSIIHRNMRITIIMGFFAQLLLLITFMNRQLDTVAPIVIIPDIFAWLIGTTWLLQNREINSLTRTVTERIEGRCCLRTNEDTLRNLICSWPLFTIALFLESVVVIENLNDGLHQFAISILCLAIVISLYMKTYYSLETTALYTRSFRTMFSSPIGYSNVPRAENEDSEVDINLDTFVNTGVDTVVDSDDVELATIDRDDHKKPTVAKTQDDYLPRQLQLERRKTEQERQYNERLKAFDLKTQIVYPTWINLNAFKSLDELLHYPTQTSLAEWLLFLEEGLGNDDKNSSKLESQSESESSGSMELLTVPINQVSTTSLTISTPLTEEKSEKNETDDIPPQIIIQSPDGHVIQLQSTKRKNKNKNTKAETFEALKRAMKNYIVLEPTDSKNNEYYLGIVSNAIELLTDDVSKTSAACKWLDKSTKKYIHERFCMTMLSDSISFGDALMWLRESNSDDDKTLEDDFEQDIKNRQNMTEFYSQCILSSLIAHGYIHTMHLYSEKIKARWNVILKLHHEKILETTMGRKEAMKMTKFIKGTKVSFEPLL